MLASLPISPGFNTNAVIKQMTECTSKVKIVKDFFFTIKGRYDEVIGKDSVNIFLVRDPRYVFTSVLPKSETSFYSAAKATHKDMSFYYQSMLEGIQVVTKLCTKPPAIIDG